MNFKDLSRILKMIKMSAYRKIKAGWSRNVSCGFLKEDISRVSLKDDTKKLGIHFKWHNNNKQPLYCRARDLNLKETIELLKYLEHKQGLRSTWGKG